MTDSFRLGGDPDKIVSAMLDDKAPEEAGDVRRERPAMPGEMALERAAEKLAAIEASDLKPSDLKDKIIDGAKNVACGYFNYFCDQPASDFKVDQEVAREFITAFNNGDVSPELFERAQDVLNNRPAALSNDGAEEDLRYNFQQAVWSTINDPKAVGLNGPMNEEGRLYADRIENGHAYYKLEELSQDTDTNVASTSTPPSPIS